VKGSKLHKKTAYRVASTSPKKRNSAHKILPNFAYDHEENLLLKEKVRRINNALDSDPVDIEALRAFALSAYGYVTDDIRCRVWPKLLNVNVYNLPRRKEVDVEQSEFRENKYFHQVRLDIDRSQRRFPSGTRVSRRRVLQSQLTNIIMRTLCRNPELHYYQGYHDIAVTLLRVVGEDLAMALLEQLSLHHIRDFMDVNMERTNRMLALIHPIISKMNEALGDFLQRAEVGQIFALSWLITWFGHNLEKFSAIVRLFDVFIATSPFMPIYIGAVIIESDSENILELDCEMSTVHSYLSKLPKSLVLEEIEEVISRAYGVYQKHPPSLLQKEARTVVGQSSSFASHRKLVESAKGQKPDSLLRRRTRQGHLLDDDYEKTNNRTDSHLDAKKSNPILKLAVWTLVASMGAMTFLVFNASKKWM